MRPITLNDKTFLYNKYTVEDYLKSLGFDVEELKEILCADIIGYNQELYNKAEDYELIADGLRNNMVSAYNELESIASDLSLGKGGTKAKMADKIMYVLNCYMDC